MTKVLIEGEGVRDDREFTKLVDAENEFYYRVIEASSLKGGYLKTWISFWVNAEKIFKHRIDLESKRDNSSLVSSLIDDCEGNLKYDLKHSGDKFCKDNINPCKNKIIFLKSLTSDGMLKDLYHYEFYYNGSKVWEYMLNAKIPVGTILCTKKILAGEEKGHSQPIPNITSREITHTETIINISDWFSSICKE